MAWIESHQSLARHPKLSRLAAILKISRPTTIGHLHLLWWWALDYTPDGDISKLGSAEIAAAADWTADPDCLLTALKQAGFVDDDGRIHDWHDYAGRLLASREAMREGGRRGGLQSGKLRSRHPSTLPSTLPSKAPLKPPLKPIEAPYRTVPTVPTNQPEDCADRPVEFHPSFPKTEKHAVEHAAFVGCSPDFAAQAWNKAAGRGGRDAKDVPIRSWRHHLATEWGYERSRPSTGTNGNHGTSEYDCSATEAIARGKEFEQKWIERNCQ